MRTVNGRLAAKPSANVARPTPDDSSVSQISIKVIVRIRPRNERERLNNGRTVVEVVDGKMLIFDPKERETSFFFRNVAQKGRDMLKKQNKHLQFIFDGIFDSTSTNADVFEGSTKNLISNLLDGYNCSVFAYGATGAGKTHTMLGCREDPGITYRTVAELFSQIENQSNHREFNLAVTYLEIYNENVQDLLHKSGQLHLREDGRCEVVIAGLKPIAIHSADELLSLLAEGNKNRTQHPTDANEESSRSHAVFQVYIKIINKLDSQVQRVKLSMIDLAGSERASATGCKGVRFKEGANINKSLLALGNCINNLADGIKYIPYRDSKLTRLLKDSLGGNCYTVMIANIGPSSCTYEDTYNTLRYANRAKKIRLNATKNVSCETHVASYIKIIEEQKKEIESLKSKLAALEGSTMVQTPTTVEKITAGEDKAAITEATEHKLLKLFERKSELIEKILALESSDKILACRILYKKDAEERLHNLTATGDVLSPEERNASGKSRINKSLHYFQRQRDSLRTQMMATREELSLQEAEIRKVTASRPTIRAFHENIQNKLSLRISEIEKCSMRRHVEKLGSLLQCERQSVNAITKTMSKTLQDYYNMVKGYGTLTDKMESQFKELIKSLEGSRNIKWSDSDALIDADEFSAFTCLSRIGTDNDATLDDATSEVRQANTLNTTFEVTSEENNRTDDDSTLNSDDLSSDTTLKNGVCHEDNVTYGKPTRGIVREKTITTASGALRKRVLSDKNRENGGTPAKQTKRLTTNIKTIVNSNGRTDKENANKQRPTRMSAKSIAILNKLKSGTTNFATLPATNGRVEEIADVALKVVRNKERRGLVTTHPYHKSTKKSSSALPSTRVPW